MIDRLIGGKRSLGCANRRKSHNAVAAAVAQGRADWGIAIETVAGLYRIEFLPVAPEHYDLMVVEAKRERSAVQPFLEALGIADVRARIATLGMISVDET